jgi:hypothetical protein
MSDDNFSDDLSRSDRNEATPGDLAKRRVTAILRTERSLPEQEDARLNQAHFLLNLYADKTEASSCKIANFEVGRRILMFGVLARNDRGHWWHVSHMHEYHQRSHKPPANLNVRSKFLQPLV